MTQVAAVREGSRWRFARPSSDELGSWFTTSVKLDDGMEHDKYVSGIVLIPAVEKVKRQERAPNDRLMTVESEEMTFTPYVRVDTRIAYFHELAAVRDMVAVIEAVEVPKIGEGPTANSNLPKGFWFNVVPTGNNQAVRYICCTQRVALYRKEDWYDEPREPRALRPAREGTATKQVPTTGRYGADVNAVAKAETGAIGRALGMAGILVIGTGIATAEDMGEVQSRDDAPAPELPAVGPDQRTPEQVNERLFELQALMAEHAPEKWAEFSAWWTDRAKAEGWAKVDDAPLEVRRGMIERMERMLDEAEAQASSDDSSQAES